MNNKFLHFLRTSLVGGAIFLLPIAVGFFLIEKVVVILQRMTKPLLPYFSDLPLGGIGVVAFGEIFALALICLLAGLLAETKYGRRAYAWLEGHMLQYIPGYIMIRTFLIEFMGGREDSTVTVVLARIEDAWQLGFLIETLDSGLLAVFVPEVPSAISGSLYYLTEDRIKRTKMTVPLAHRTLRRFGVGSKKLLKDVI